MMNMKILVVLVRNTRLSLKPPPTHPARCVGRSAGCVGRRVPAGESGGRGPGHVASGLALDRRAGHRSRHLRTLGRGGSGGAAGRTGVRRPGPAWVPGAEAGPGSVPAGKWGSCKPGRRKAAHTPALRSLSSGAHGAPPFQAAGEPGSASGRNGAGRPAGTATSHFSSLRPVSMESPSRAPGTPVTSADPSSQPLLHAGPQIPF